MTLKDYINTLKVQLNQENLKEVSVYSTGVLKLVFDSEATNKINCMERLIKYGIYEYDMEIDPHSHSILVTVKL
jgi:hypothetical protein